MNFIAGVHLQKQHIASFPTTLWRPSSPTGCLQTLLTQRLPCRINRLFHALGTLWYHLSELLCRLTIAEGYSPPAGTGTAVNRPAAHRHITLPMNLGTIQKLNWSGRFYWTCCWSCFGEAGLTQVANFVAQAFRQLYVAFGETPWIMPGGFLSISTPRLIIAPSGWSFSGVGCSTTHCCFFAIRESRAFSYALLCA